MRNAILAAGLSLALGSGVALADEGQTKDAKPAKATTMGEAQPIDLFFDTDSAVLKESATADLKKLADATRCNPKAAIILEGHADKTGAANYNVKLSAQRAAAVREKLISMGVGSDHIVVSVYGENAPNRATLAEDRRVTAKMVERPVSADDLSG